MRFKQMWMTTMAFALAAVPVMAQDRPDGPPPGQGGAGGAGGGGRGGEGGRGGMGGGMGGGMRSPLSPEKAQAAWKLQAESVGRKLELDAAKTTKVVEAYSAVRDSQQKASDKLREEMRAKAEEAAGNADDEGGRGGMREMMAEMQKAITELNRTEREKLVAKLAESLDTEQTRKAAASLGTFNNQWDVMVDMLAGFNLEADKLNTSLAATETYVIAAEHARGFGMDDPESMRTAMQEARANLNDAVKPHLTEEQFTQFQRAGGRGGRGRGGEGGGGEPGQGGGGRGGNGGRGGGAGGGQGGQGGGGQGDGGN